MKKEIEIIARRASRKFGAFRSSHEALGVALEEFNELCDAVKSNDMAQITRECADLAAVCIRMGEAAQKDLPFIRRSGGKG